MTSEQHLTSSQKNAIRSILVSIGALAIVASCYTIYMDGLDISNSSGLYSGGSLLFFGLVGDKLISNKKG